MKKFSFIFLFALFTIIFFLSGCWNYREINRFAIIAGAAIDRGTDLKYKTTTEIIGFKPGKENEVESKWVVGEGNSILDALSNSYQISGLMGYWNHIKILLISQEVAKEGILPVVDLFNRSPLSRMTIKILISKAKTAGEILKVQSISHPIKSFQINDTFKVQEESLSKTKAIAVYQAINLLGGEGTALFLPTVDLSTNNGQTTYKLTGTAVFKKDKLVGFLDGEESKYLLFVRDEIKGGVMLENLLSKEKPTTISLIIKKSQTKTKPVLVKGKLRMEITLKTQADIWEMDTAMNYNSEKGRMTLERHAEEALQKNIQRVVSKVQQDYGADIFGFSTKIRNKTPALWKTIKPDWERVFKELPVDVKVEVKIQNSGLAFKTLEMGE